MIYWRFSLTYANNIVLLYATVNTPQYERFCTYNPDLRKMQVMTAIKKPPA
jgi:hypothetical protein